MKEKNKTAVSAYEFSVCLLVIICKLKVASFSNLAASLLNVTKS